MEDDTVVVIAGKKVDHLLNQDHHGPYPTTTASTHYNAKSINPNLLESDEGSGIDEGDG